MNTPHLVGNPIPAQEPTDEPVDPFLRDAETFRKLFPEPAPSRSDGKTILILDRGSTGYIRFEIYLYRVLMSRGIKLIAVGWRQPDVVRYYDLLGIPFYYWDQFTPHVESESADSLLSGTTSVEQVRRLERQGVRLGVHALAESLRSEYLMGDRTRPPRTDRVPASIGAFLVRALQGQGAAAAILDRFMPEVVLFGDGLYTLQGTFLDEVLNRRIDPVMISPALQDNCLYLRRYTRDNRDWPYTSLSPSNWERLLTAPWTRELGESFHRRHKEAYRRGEWYSLRALTKHTQPHSRVEVETELGLEPGRPRAVLFPHVLWEAPVYGNNLFQDHATWLVAVVQAALQNPRVDWIIKLHPANVFSVANEDFATSPVSAELGVLQDLLRAAGQNIKVLAPDTNVDTRSLLETVNYCLTETGTAGIEAAAMGVTVVTGGASHYSHRGFTVDSTSQEELVGRVRRLDQIPAISADSRSLAERFAFATFFQKPFRLKSLAVRFPDATNSGMEVVPLVREGKAFANSQDMTALVDWLVDSSEEDYISNTPAVDEAE